MSFNTNSGVETSPEIDLDRYNHDHIETFLQNYDSLIGHAAELAAEWSNMDEEEQVIQRSFVMSDWDKRSLLGKLYRAGRLTPDQVARLAELDRALLEEAANVEISYGPSLRMLVESLLDWGTPLTEVEGTVRLAVPFKALPALAQVLAEET